jgi:predicted O-linked N-acetylglucosamine transferase (SPINDLY family)
MVIQSNGAPSPSHSDHFLRRKTPNGVLNAAYDGTSVEQTERPHAMKHILLPVSDHFPHTGLRGLGVAQDMGVMPSIPTYDARSPYSTPNLRSPMPTDAWGNALVMTPEHASSPWAARPTGMTPLDSVLNQLPLQTAQQLMAYPQHPNGHLHGFMPSPAQAPFVPTASGSYQTFGPFWPHPGYQNYIPAATRDVFWTAALPPQSQFLPNSGQLASYSGWHMNNSTPRPGLPNPGFGGGMFPPARSLPPNQYPSTQNYYQSPPQAQTPNFAYAPSLAQTPHMTPNLTPNLTPSVPLGYPLHVDLPIPAETPSSRERVFEQAVIVYQELVKHLGRARAASGGRSSTLPLRYPRPPRPAGSDAPLPIQRHNSTGTIGSDRPPLPSQHRHSFINDHASRTALLSGADAAAWQSEANTPLRSPPAPHRLVHLRTGSDALATSHDHLPFRNALAALDLLTVFCQESNWTWIEGLLLGGSLAYALADYSKAYEWYSKILKVDPRHVETITNLGATLMAMEQKDEAERFWRKAVQLRPGRFDAVEHLVGLFCTQGRNKDAIAVIDYVENALRRKRRKGSHILDANGDFVPSESDDRPMFDYETERDHRHDGNMFAGSDQPGFASSGYAIPGTENGRMHTLVHARGNLLYGAGDVVGAARAFEEAVLITVGRQFGTIDGLVSHILAVLSREVGLTQDNRGAPEEPLLIPPSFALETLRLCFPPDGNLPGLRELPSNGTGLRSALGTTSNSLLSLAKIFQDSMASSNPKPMPFRTNFGVREILALYYLSISLQKSPSTANNVGILLAGLQQQATPKMLSILGKENLPNIPGVVPGTGISMALAYYNFGLNLDRKHAHLYTNLGSLLKDLGQLNTAIKMYDEAVKCDPKFDIALANLANAVKDQGRIHDAIRYYKRAVDASPDFAEAVCGLANALNSVCGWSGRGGIASDRGSRDRWHVDENGMLRDGTNPGAISSGWIKRVVDLVDKQLAGGELWGQGLVSNSLIDQLVASVAITIRDPRDLQSRTDALRKELISWQGRKWEGHRVVRAVERVTKRLTWQWYQDSFVNPQTRPPGSYNRPMLPPNLPVPTAPTVLPFHTFTSPMSARQIRQISQRNGLRISCSTLKAPWLPLTVWRPPRPPNPYFKVGYVSSDFNNHPLAHLMQSVFGMHNTNKVKAYCYATTASDNSIHRQKIEREAPRFHDASTWSAERLVKQIVDDGIHILVNLNGYTRGARNEVFAARPAPIQMSFMGFAGTLGAEWCDYLLADETAVPPSTLRPWRRNVEIEDQLQDDTVGSRNSEDTEWIYGENLIYCRDTFFCCDHKQSAPDAQEELVDWDEELKTRRRMRKEIFPDLPEDAIIIGNFNQLYKVRYLIE